MKEQADKRPDQLSGGQKQRVAIAGALFSELKQGSETYFPLRGRDKSVSTNLSLEPIFPPKTSRKGRCRSSGTPNHTDIINESSTQKKFCLSGTGPFDPRIKPGSETYFPLRGRDKSVSGTDFLNRFF